MIVRALGLVIVVVGSVGLAGCASDTAVAGSDPAVDEDEVTAASSSLTFPLIGREWNSTTKTETLVPLDSLNAALAAKGVEGFKDKALTFGRDGGAKFKALLAKVDAANKALKREIELEARWDPSDYKGLCYNGSVRSVMKTVDALRGSAFDTDMGVQASRYGDQKKVYNQTEAAWLKEQHEELGNDAQITAWKKFDQASDSFLMMTDGGPQGDGSELFVVLIPKCK